MGIVQKDALRVTLISYLGLVLGYVNKAFLMILFLKVEEIGILNLLLTVGILFGQAANLGTSYTIVRFFPFFADNLGRSLDFLKRLLFLVGIGCLLFLGVFYLFENQIIAYYSKNGTAFLEYSVWLFPVGISYAYYLLFEGYCRSLFLNVLPAFLFEFILRLCIMITLLLYGFDYINFKWLIILHSLVYAIPTVFIAYYLAKNHLLSIRSQKEKTSRRLRAIVGKYSGLSYLNTLVITTVISIDAIMISGMLGLKEAGIYTTIGYLTSALMVPYRSILKVCAPIVAKHWKKKEMTELQKLYTMSSSVCLFIALVMFSGIWISRFEIFSLLPKEYYIGIQLFLALMIGRIVDMYFGLNGSILSSSKRYSVDLIFTVILLSGIIISNYLFIPIYGLMGAAVATSVTVIIYNILRLTYVWIKYKIHPFEKSQFHLILIFCGFLLLMDLFFPAIENKIISFALKSVTMLALVLIPIYYFRIEKNASDYMGQVFLKAQNIAKGLLNKSSDA